MKTSETTDKISPAIIELQAAMENPVKNATGQEGNLKYEYFTLPDLLNKIRPMLKKNGLGLMQPASGDGQSVSVKTRIIHSSSQWIETDPVSFPVPEKIKELGKIITYLRRYELAGLLNISGEEDADATTENPPKVKKATGEVKAPKKTESAPDGWKMNQKQQNLIRAKASDCDINWKAFCEEMGVSVHLSEFSREDFDKVVTRLSELEEAEKSKYIDRIYATMEEIGYTPEDLDRILEETEIKSLEGAYLSKVKDVMADLNIVAFDMAKEA